jgi:hypothetical protein
MRYKPLAAFVLSLQLLFYPLLLSWLDYCQSGINAGTIAISPHGVQFIMPLITTKLIIILVSINS